MLPGFRFLFAAIVFSMSALVFGLGAAAVLRAAHEQFAESGSWRPAPEAAVARESETTGPVLAMLRVDPPSAPAKAADAPALTTPGQPAEAASPPPDAERSAAQHLPIPSLPESGNAEPAKPEAPKSDIAKSEVAPDAPKPEDEDLQASVAATNPAPRRPTQPEAPATQSAAVVEAPVAIDTKTATADPAPPAEPVGAPAAVAPQAADEPTASSTSAPAPAAPEPASAPAAPEQANTPAAADPATARIATLGGPPVAIDGSATQKAVRAGPDPDEVKKEREKQRAEERGRRRRLAERRARLAREAAQAQAAADPFGQPNQAMQYVQPGLVAGATARTR